MTVQELILRLSTFDPNLLVAMPSENYDWVEVGGAFEDIMWRSPKGDLQLSDEDNAGSFLVVRLFEPDDD